LLSVTAKEQATGKEQSITISGASTLDKNDVERMVRDAETHGEEDKRRRENLDTKNNADSLVYQAEKQLNDLDGQVSETDKGQAESLIAELRSAIAQQNADQMRSLTNDLQQALMQIGSAVYAQAGASKAGASKSNATNEPSGQDDVIDADFVG
jgi:molecular chaperone DnaK